MNLLIWFVRRPVGTTLFTLSIALSGILAFKQLPVASLPQVDFPTISVSAQLPGASPETMAATVATPLERSLGRIAGVTEMTSSSSQGNTRVTLQFNLDREINGAARDVQAAINAASSMLPTGMPNRPNYRRENPSDSPILILALTSNTVNRAEMYDLASTVLAQKLSQIPGIGQVQISGGSLPAVRVELNPLALHHYGIGFEDVRTTISRNNLNIPKGVIQNEENRWEIHANDQAREAKDYLPLIVSYRDGAPIRISDVGEVNDSVEDLRNTGVKNETPAILLVIRKQPNANVIETVDQVKSLLPSLQANLPESIQLSVASDRSLTIRASIQEVETTMLIAIMLVMLVVLIFLRDIRSSLIPIIAVPVSLLGAFSVMYLLNYSLNNLSLMALTIATGFVVDDAIVVMENSSRHVENGMSPTEAAIKAISEVGFTVVAMTLSLIAVFVPILLMGGIVGRLFREFAVTLTSAVLVSLLVSLTTTPMLCSLWLGKHIPSENPLYLKIGHLFDSSQNFYRKTLATALKYSKLTLLLLTITIGFNFYLYATINKGFFPTQDGGRLMGNIQTDQGASFWTIQNKLFSFAKAISQDQAVDNVVGFAGNQQNSNGAEIFISLKPHDQRDTIEKVQDRIRKLLDREPGAKIRLFPAQELRIGGRSSGGLFEYSLQSDDLSLLREWTPKVVSALSKIPLLKDVNTNQQDKGEQISIKINHDLATRLGVSQALIDTTLNDAFGQRQVSVIYNQLNQYRVVMEVAPEYWQSPEVLQNLYISVPEQRQTDGKLIPAHQVPLASIAEFGASNTPLSVNHQGQFAATTVAFNLAPGVSLSQATVAIKEAMSEINLPIAIQGSFQGSAKAFQDSLRDQPFLILAAIITIYLVLGMLYESYIHPITILSTLPSTGVGALLALMLCDTDFSIIALIGVILLIGIVKKNAIMMIDFALQLQKEHDWSAKDAIFEASVMRFRPIMMTTSAALFGALPLAMGNGYGAELRHPLGISIVGGLLISQILTLYTTPVVYIYLDGLSNKLKSMFAKFRGHKAIQNV